MSVICLIFGHKPYIEIIFPEHLIRFFGSKVEVDKVEIIACLRCSMSRSRITGGWIGV